MKFKTLLFFIIAIFVQLAFAAPTANYNELQSAIDEAAKEQLVPGAIVHVTSPHDHYTIAYGKYDIHKTDAPRADDHFRIGSNTKSMMSAVILQLAQENALSLEDPISRYIKNVPNGDKITLALLMQNRSGLYNYTQDPILSKTFDKNPDHIWTPDEILKIAFKHPVLFAPGEQFNYCNTNFILLGLVAEKVEKKPLYKIFENRLFKPLNMKHTYLPHGSQTKLPKPFAHGYGFGKSAHVLSGEAYSKEDQEKIIKGKIKPKDYTVQSVSWGWAAGGVVSTAEDLAIWVQALAEGKLFNEKIHEEWRKGFTDIDGRNAYGYGILRLKDSEKSTEVFFHNGQLPGFNSFMIYDPEKKMSVIIWTSLGITITGAEPADRLVDIVHKKVL